MSKPRDDEEFADSESHSPSMSRQMKPIETAISHKGPLAWFARNTVAANVFMAIILAAGLFAGSRIKQEVFPEVDLDMIMIEVPYPGATPEEVESGVVLVTEEAVRGLDGVKKVTSTAAENFGLITVEVTRSAEPDKVLSDVESAIGRVSNFPDGTERPRISLATNRQRQVSLIVSGELDEAMLRNYAEKVRAELLLDHRITVVELSGVRSPEISIEVPPENLQRYHMTLDQLAARVRAAAVEIPGGVVRTSGGEILLRTAERRDEGREFEDIIVSANADGTQVKLTDIATIRDTFEESAREATFDGRRAIGLDVYRVGEQTPMDISDAVAEYIDAHGDNLPDGVALTSYMDFADMYRDRLDLMTRNAMLGLVLVLVVLGLFLEIRLAFWVTLGIPISFVGALIFMPGAGASVNMISLFAFIIVLGMVVDDAIVVGEAIYRRRQQGMGALDAAIGGLREVAVPVVFAVVTTMAAFAPMLFLPGFMGDFFRIIPIVVISVLMISLFESLFILPAHLAHASSPSKRGAFGWLTRKQQTFGKGLEWLVEHTYLPTLRHAVAHRYITLSVAIGVLIAAVGLVAGGRIGFVFFPKVEGDITVASLHLPRGAAAERTGELRDHLVTSAQQALAELGSVEDSRGIFAQLGATSYSQGFGGLLGQGGSHIAEVAIYLVPVDDRKFTSAEFVQKWREKLGELKGVESLRFQFDSSGTGEAPFQLDLSHPDKKTLERAAADLAARLARFDGVFDIDDGITEGKQQLAFNIKPSATRLGVTELELARQVRASFFGAEALRVQRGRYEVKVYVRYTAAHRRSESDIERMLIRTGGGGDVPLPQIATITRGRADTAIVRRDGRRIASVSADVDEAAANANNVMAKVLEEHFPELEEKYPGLSYSFGGMQQSQKETMSALGAYYLIALLVIFALLAVAFRSYAQPVIIMFAIPFGIVGALLGHLVMGFDMSVMSILGIVALSGVVVNDSLILIVAINKYRAAGFAPREAIQLGGRRRFRPILLTSLTTFFGLAPMLLETSVQARFLIPMAISLAFGIMMSTALLLIVVPSIYMILDDAHRAFRATWAFVRFGDTSSVGAVERESQPSESAIAELVSTGDFVRAKLGLELDASADHKKHSSTDS